MDPNKLVKLTTESSFLVMSDQSQPTVPNDDLVSKVLELTSKKFKLKLYTQCLKLLTQAIEYADTLDQKSLESLRVRYHLSPRPSYYSDQHRLYHPKLVTLLDSRAVVYEKLQSLRDAVKDSQRIVEIEPYNPKGYLRLGKLYEAGFNNLEKAMVVYTKGLKIISEGMRKFNLKMNKALTDLLRDSRQGLSQKLKAIQTQKQNGNKKIKLAKSYDPSDFLPFELFEFILSFLSLKDTATCLLVCHNWYKNISRMSLFKRIAIKHSNASPKELQCCFRLASKSSSSIEDLSICSIRRPDELQVFKFIAQQSKVKIRNKLQIDFQDLTLKQIVELLDDRSLLRNLNVLRIQAILSPTFEEILLNKLHNLQSLTLTASPTDTNLKAPLNYTPQIRPFDRLKSLNLIKDIRKRDTSFPFLYPLLHRDYQVFPNLENLLIVGCNFQKFNREAQTFNFLQSLPKLKTLIFENNTNLTFNDVLKNHDILEFSGLQKFVFREYKIQYSDSLHLYDPLYFSKIFENLAALDLTGSSITFQGLGKILRVSGINLKSLSIGLCSNLIYKKAPFVRNTPTGGFFEFDNFVKWCPNLQVLNMNQSVDFNDFAITELLDSMKSQRGLTILEKIDLSFNSDLSIYKILDLVKYRPLKILTLHGLFINSDTKRFMETNRYVGKVESRLDKQNWKEYGLTSYDPFVSG